MNHLKSALINAPSCEYSVPTSPQWILTRLSNSTLHGISSIPCTGPIRLRPPLIRYQPPARLPSLTPTPCLPTFPRSPPASGLPVSPDANQATRNWPSTAAIRPPTRSATRLSSVLSPQTLHRFPSPASKRHTARIPAPPSFSHPYTTPELPLLHTPMSIGLANGQTVCTTIVFPPLYPVPHPSNPLPTLQSQASRVEIRL